MYLPDEGKYVVRLRHFRGEIEVEEAAFFVRSYDAATGEIALSDRSRERLDPATLHLSPEDGALRCRVKAELAAEGLLARFTQAAQAELLLAVEERDAGPRLRAGDQWLPLPEL